MAGLSLSFQIRSAAAAVSTLHRRIGLASTARVLAGLVRAKLAGEPWKKLAKPESEKDRLSRAQSGDAVLLYRALSVVEGPVRALEVLGEVVLEASLLFLAEQIPEIDPKAIAAMDEDARRRFILDIADRFFNADMGEVETGERSFRYEVVRCRFVELMREVGCPEVAPLFCRGDFLFFEKNRPHVALERPVCLAADGEPCDFRFSLVD